MQDGRPLRNLACIQGRLAEELECPAHLQDHPRMAANSFNLGATREEPPIVGFAIWIVPINRIPGSFEQHQTIISSPTNIMLLSNPGDPRTQRKKNHWDFVSISISISIF